MPRGIYKRIIGVNCGLSSQGFQKGHNGFRTKESYQKMWLMHKSVLKGKKLSGEHKEKIRQTNKRKGIKPPSFEGNEHTEQSKQKMRQKRLLQIFPTKDTSIEIKIQEALKEVGIQFEKHKPLLNKYQVDLFIEPNLVIECDGNYWHNFPDGLDRDRIKDVVLKEAGYKVLRFWEHEINQSAQECINKIFNN